MVDIKELYTRINIKLRTAGKPKIDELRWVEEVSVLQVQGIIDNNKGELKLGGDKSEGWGY